MAGKTAKAVTTSGGGGMIALDEATGLLRGLVGDAPEAAVSTAVSANWLIHAGLGPLAQAKLPSTSPEARILLQGDAYTAVAENAIRQQAFAYLAQKLHEANLRIVPLKGMALALTIYADPSQRVMSDIDLWLDDAGMAQAAELMPRWGYLFGEKHDRRPRELEKLSDGEIKFLHPRWPTVLIELHWSPFPGWWLKRTAVTNAISVWNRCQKHQFLGQNIHILSPEDTLLQLIIHVSVNHQFALSSVRTLVDMALLAEKYTVNWDVLVERAQAWRVSTAVWLTLHLALQILPPRGLTPTHLQPIQPRATHQRQLAQFVNPTSIINHDDITTSWRRYLLLTLLVDRPRDRLKLIGRTLWPEPDWLRARYGAPTNNWQHLARLLKSRDV